MSRITIDASLSARLRGLTHPVELCDETGKVLGQFVPLRTEDASLQPQITAEELARRKQQPGGRTLAEIMADLERQV